MACLPFVEDKEAPVEDGVAQGAVRGINGEGRGLIEGERHACCGSHDHQVRLQQAAIRDNRCRMAQSQLGQRSTGLPLRLHNSMDLQSTRLPINWQANTMHPRQPATLRTDSLLGQTVGANV